MAIRKITTTISNFSVTPQVNTATFPTDIDTYNAEYPGIISQTNDVRSQMNNMATDMDGVANQVAIDAGEVATNKNITVSAKDEAIQAKDEIQSYVIPTEATYDPATIVAKIRRAKILNMIGA